MTCIVGIAARGSVYLGGDTAVSDTDSGGLWRGGSKLFRVGPLLVGTAGGSRAARILRFSVKLPPVPRGLDPFEYLAGRFADAVHAAYESSGATDKVEGRDCMDGCALIGYSGRLFHLGADFGVTECVEGEAAIGSGCYPAFGALYATRAQGPSERLRIALEASAEYIDTVRGPFTFEALGPVRANRRAA
jgi:hypothetical protein